MFRIRTYNQIALRGLERFPRDRFEVASELSEPDALLLRSHPLGGDDIPPTVKAVARAGAGDEVGRHLADGRADAEAMAGKPGRIEEAGHAVIFA